MDQPSQEPTGFVKFDASLRIGLPTVDEQHGVLIGELNRLIVDTGAGTRSAVFSEVLSRLGRELQAHFDFEEQVLAGLGMPEPEVTAHVSAHRSIMSQYAELNLELMERRPVSRSDGLTLIRCWVLDHIVGHDLKMRSYLPPVSMAVQ